MPVTGLPSVFVTRRKSGEPVVCRVVLTFESEDTGKCYVLLTDGSRSEQGSLRVFAAIYNGHAKPEFVPVESERDLEIVDALVERYGSRS